MSSASGLTTGASCWTASWPRRTQTWRTRCSRLATTTWPSYTTRHARIVWMRANLEKRTPCLSLGLLCSAPICLVDGTASTATLTACAHTVSARTDRAPRFSAHSTEAQRALGHASRRELVRVRPALSRGARLCAVGAAPEAHVHRRVQQPGERAGAAGPCAGRAAVLPGRPGRGPYPGADPCSPLRTLCPSLIL